MEKMKGNWFTNPTGRQLFILTVVLGISVLLLILSLSDLFAENFFKKTSVLTYAMIFIATLVVVNLHLNYWKNRSKG